MDGLDKIDGFFGGSGMYLGTGFRHPWCRLRSGRSLRILEDEEVLTTSDIARDPVLV